jgi:hypothetical protein
MIEKTYTVQWNQVTRKKRHVRTQKKINATAKKVKPQIPVMKVEAKKQTHCSVNTKTKEWQPPTYHAPVTALRPVEPQKLPAVHVVGADTPASQNEPIGHGAASASCDPVTQKNPAAHAPVTTLSPCVAQYERDVHGTGADMLALAHRWPGSHSVANLLPAAQ